MYYELKLPYAIVQNNKMINMTLPYNLAILNNINRRCNCRKAWIGHQKSNLLFQTPIQISKHAKTDITHFRKSLKDTSAWFPYLEEQNVKERGSGCASVPLHEYFTFLFTRLTSRKKEDGKKERSFNEFWEIYVSEPRIRTTNKSNLD